MNELQKRIKNLAEKFKPVAAIVECGSCSNWRVNKDCQLERDHAAQGRAMCRFNDLQKGAFLHHRSAGCDKHNFVDSETQKKRTKFLEGK